MFNPTMPKASSYHLECCGADCDWLDAVAGEPCWGAVEGIGDDWDEDNGEEYRHHACQGHIARDEGEPYIPEHAA